MAANLFSLVPLLSIAWNISPELFTLELGKTVLPITWYGLLFTAGFLVGQYMLGYIFAKEGKPASQLDRLTIYVVLATVIGARLGHFLFYEWELLLKTPAAWFTQMVIPPFAGLASHGATLSLLLALFWYSRKWLDESFLWLLDRMVIPGCLAGAFIRLGNLFNSEIYGSPTDLPWGFVFEQESDLDLLPLVPRHPTGLYESLFCLVLLGLTFYLWKNKRHRLPEGFISGLFLVLLFSFRFLIEFLKNSQADFEKGLVFNMGQLLSIPAIVLGLLLLIRAYQNMKGPTRSISIPNGPNGKGTYD